MVSIEKESASSELVGNKYFNVDKYKARMKMTFETFLIEANARGVTAKKKIYCHVVGLGLGVWELPGCNNQTYHFLTAFRDALVSLSEKKAIGNIGVIDFSYIDGKDCFSDINFVKIKFSHRNPFAILDSEVRENYKYRVSQKMFISNEGAQLTIMNIFLGHRVL